MNNEKNKYLYEERYNNQGYLMKIVEYNNASDIVIEFQDEYKFRINTIYTNFKRGCIKNPYANSVYGIGIIGAKYQGSFNGIRTKEHTMWRNMIRRCFKESTKTKQPAYKDAICCNEWVLYENFYEWLRSQENFDKWRDGNRWALDKDILIKNNKLYSPKTCCLVPQSVNCLLLKRDALRGDLPLGVKSVGDKFHASCGNPFTRKQEFLGSYETIEEAFYKYKYQREFYIKQVAEIEYNAGNITKPCYEALMNYSIEIND